MKTAKLDHSIKVKPKEYFRVEFKLGDNIVISKENVVRVVGENKK